MTGLRTREGIPHQVCWPLLFFPSVGLIPRSVSIVIVLHLYHGTWRIFYGAIKNLDTIWIENGTSYQSPWKDISIFMYFTIWFINKMKFNSQSEQCFNFRPALFVSIGLVCHKDHVACGICARCVQVSRTSVRLGCLCWTRSEFTLH